MGRSPSGPTSISCGGGWFGLWRSEVEPFAAQQVQALQTFAELAATAIERAQLAEEVEQERRALAEALERERATADVLRIVADAPTELTEVLRAICERAAR